MPFQDSNGFELASYKPLQRILDSEKVNNFESRLKVRKPNEGEEQEELELTDKDSLQPSAWQPSMVVAIDGSYQSVPVKNGFPSAEYGYVTVASVLILLDKIRELEKAEFINPVEFRKTEVAGTTESVYAGANIVIDEEESAKSSMRKMLFEEFLNEAPFYDKDEPKKETLLETYEHLLKLRILDGKESLPECPYDDCENRLSYGYGNYVCLCKKSKKLYSTDALRLHELHNSIVGCGEMYGQIMYTMERLWLINILRAFEKMNLLSSLKQTAFILDGSLTVNSSSSWLAKSIKKELYRINEEQKKVTKQDLIIIGIEKSGTAVNHFEMIDKDEEGIIGKFPTQTALLLSKYYINSKIVYNSNPEHIPREDTSFGRKFLYKTKNGYRVVCDIATFTDYQQELKTAYPNQFPRLADVMSLLDQIVSNRFQNSVSPLISAHAEAAIPLNLGKRIFQEIAREIRNRT